MNEMKDWLLGIKEKVHRRNGNRNYFYFLSIDNPDLEHLK